MKNKIIKLTLLLGIFFSYFIVGFLVFVYQQDDIDFKKNEIENLKKSVKEYKKNASDLLKLNEKMQNNINEMNKSKLNNISEFRFGDEKITTENLLEIVNKSFKENIKLEVQLENKIKLLDLIKNSYDIETIETENTLSIKVKDNSVLKKVETNINKLQEQVFKLKKEVEYNKKLLKMIENNYGIKSIYTENDKTVDFEIIPSTKIDSALRIYPFYKHKLFKNKKGEWIVK